MTEAAAGEQLKAGVQYRCPHCRKTHTVVQPYAATRPTAERLHLYVVCRGRNYFVGQISDSAPNGR